MIVKKRLTNSNLTNDSWCAREHTRPHVTSSCASRARRQTSVSNSFQSNNLFQILSIYCLKISDNCNVLFIYFSNLVWNQNCFQTFFKHCLKNSYTKHYAIQSIFKHCLETNIFSNTFHILFEKSNKKAQWYSNTFQTFFVNKHVFKYFLYTVWKFVKKI